MSASTPALLQTIYTAYRESVSPMCWRLTDDFHFTLHLPADALPGAGTPHGKADTCQAARRLIGTTSFLMYEPGPIMATGDQPACACASGTATRRRPR